MSVALADRFLWDFWTIEAGGLTWLYALSAPRDPDPETRHDRARVDVLTSADLTDWTWRGVALAPGPAGAWDDLSIWTGSVAADPAGGYAMLYTGRCRAERGRVQRIGLARSDDLLTWHRHPEPVLEADPAWYRLGGTAGETHWRDPWLQFDATRGLWQAFVTAQHRDGPPETCGTVALAESPDLLRWTCRAPVVTERLSEHLEVPQLLPGGQAMLVNVYPHHLPEGGRLPKGCHSLLFRHDGAHFAFAERLESWPSDARYVLKQVRPGLGLCWEGRQADGTFLGRISDPFAFTPR